jgi:protease-4
MALMGYIGTMASYLDTSEHITEKHYSGEEFGANKVAILSITGVIMEGDGYVKHQIDHIRKDKRVKAVVVRVDSPGGTITGSDYILHHLKKLKEEKDIPLVVSMGSMAASGGYYVSMAVGKEEKSIYAEPTTTTGSIGVIIPHYDVSSLMSRFDVKDDSIASGPNKQMLSMTRPLSEEQRALVQNYINEAFERFKNIIKEGRPAFAAAPEKLDALATGEIFSAVKAKENGLVDELGFVEDAIARAMELANLNNDETTVVRYERPLSLFDGLTTMQAPGSSELSALFELSIPRAYYLSTTLPAILSNRRAE